MDRWVNRIIAGDNATILKEFPSECIDLVVTSPPYDNLRTYGGHTWDFHAVANQLTRVLKPGGVIVWIVSDETVNGSETGSSMRQALHFMELGLNLHDTMIWEKGVVAFPESVRYNQKMEFMFVLSKSSPSIFNGIKDHRNVSVGRTVHGKDRNRDGSFKERTGLGNEIPEYSLRGNVWHIWNQHRGIEHPAPFPITLARDHILSWSNPGDIVLDPFAGSCTTAVAAHKLRRNWCMIELNQEYVAMAEARIKRETAQMRLLT